MAVMKNFRAADMPGKGKKLEDKSGKRETTPPAVEQPNPKNDELPEGTTAEILEWVGDNPTRARKALAAERKTDDPRVTLVEPLQKIIDDAKAAKNK